MAELFDQDGDTIQLHESKDAAIDPTPGVMYRELGQAWLSSSFVRAPIEDYNHDLTGLLGFRTYDRMRRSDAQVRASLKLIKTPVLSADWYMEPASESELDEEVSEFVWWNLTNMHKPFNDVLREAMSFLDFGCYTFEKVYERADWIPEKTEDRPKPRHRPVVKWAHWNPRHPATISQWNVANGKIVSMRQFVDGRQVDIPVSKLIHLALDAEADDPWGISILRSAYPHWYFKQNLYKVDAIQKERHGIGIPRAHLAVGFSDEDKAFAIELCKNLRTNEKAFIVEPPNVVIDFVKPEGNLVDVLNSAQHHGLMILQNVLAQFLSLGTQESGSRAVGSTQIDAFQRSARYLTDFVRETINTQAIPQLVDFNYTVDKYPKLRARRIGEDNELRALSVSLKNLVDSGVIEADDELEAWVRDWADWPSKGRSPRIPPKVQAKGLQNPPPTVESEEEGENP